MSFGFAVGDFIAVGKLIHDITGCLQNVGGARSEYEELIRELQTLKSALQSLDKTSKGLPESPKVSSIKFAALSCRHTLEKFLAKISDYESSLGLRSNAGLVKKTRYKLRWTFAQSNDVLRLQHYLNIHIGTNNILLAENGLEQMDFSRETAEAHHAEVRKQLASNSSFLSSISDNILAQAAVVHNVQTMVSGLHTFVFNELKTSWELFGRTIARVCVSTQQIYTVVLEIRAALPGHDVRYTNFQAPLLIEDALGRKYPVPSECDYGMIDAILRYKFQIGPGSRHVLAGNYELCKTSRISHVYDASSALLPGMAITMVILVLVSDGDGLRCPVAGCESFEISAASDAGTFTCLTCGACFTQTERIFEEVTDGNNVDNRVQGVNTSSYPQTTDHEPLKNLKWALRPGNVSWPGPYSNFRSSRTPKVTWYCVECGSLNMDWCDMCPACKKARR